MIRTQCTPGPPSQAGVPIHPEMRSIRVVIAGPSRLSRDLVAQRLELIGRDLRVVEHAVSVEGAVRATRRHLPDMVILLEGDAGDVDAVRSSCPRPPQVVLMPAEAVDAPGATVLPRSRYTTRAMVSALSRVAGRC